MVKSIKSGIVAAVVVAAGFAAYQSYGSYGLQDNSLLMQNVEAMASNPEPMEGDSNGDVILASIGLWKKVKKVSEGIWTWCSRQNVKQGSKNAVKWICVDAAEDITVDALISAWNSMNPSEQISQTVSRYIPSGEVREELVEKCHGCFVMETKIAKVCSWDLGENSDCYIIGDKIWVAI